MENALNKPFALKNLLVIQYKVVVLQVIVFAIIAGAILWMVNNAIHSLKQAGYIAGFAFLQSRAGISIPDSLISYSADSTFGTAIIAGLLNTIFMSIICIIAASIIGFVVGIGRLSTNWLFRKICLVYVEFFRNLPPLLVIFFTYFAVFMALPDARNSISFFGSIYLNRRGLFLPSIDFVNGRATALLTIGIGIITSILLLYLLRRMKFFELQSLISKSILNLIVFLLPCVIAVIAANPTGVTLPAFHGFNFSGGLQVLPETSALFIALSLYTGALIAETVRAGFLGVNQNYDEAALALGLKKSLVRRLIIIPLALRIIIPPLSSQYMNLVKNTSLGIAIGFSELTRIGNSIIENKNQSIEVVFIWLVVYLGLSLTVAILMNWFNKKMSLVES